MKTHTTFAVLFLLALCTLGVPAAAQEQKPGDMGMTPEQMQAMMQAMSPGEQHKRMAKMAGDWTFTNKFWMAPGAPAAESSGTMHAETLMGGRYVQETWKGDMMGMPFEGRATSAYDNVAKQYISTWIDNMGTGIMVQTGSCDEAAKTCTLAGDTMDPMSGKKMTMKSVITWLDDNSFRHEMYAPDPSGKEMKMMEIVAKRKM